MTEESIMNQIRNERLEHYRRYNEYPDVIHLEPGKAMKLLTEVSRFTTNPETNFDKVIMKGEIACAQYINDNGLHAYGVRIKVGVLK